MTNFLNRLTIGLTGGIGSGKTVASDYFATLGIDVVDADIISHAITAKGSPVLNELQMAFGMEIVQDGELNRSLLRNLAFADADKLARLNAITHPAIRRQILQELQQATSPYVILSAPLLLESIKGDDKGLSALCDRILVIDVPLKVQLHRASGRDGQSMAQIHNIINKQIDRSTRLALADDIVDNTGDLLDLHRQLDKLHEQYLRLVSK